MFVMKKITLFIFCVNFTIWAFSQTTVYWRTDGPSDGKWTWGSTCEAGSDGQWFYNSWGGNRQRPDCFGNHDVYFDGNGINTMDLNGLNDYGVRRIFFTSNATANRILNNSGDRTLWLNANSGNPKIENNSTGSHTFNVPITLNANAELNPVNGDLTFSSINNGGYWIDVWGGAGKTLTINGVMSGSSGLSVKNNTKVIISSQSTYTGATFVEGGGVLEIQQSISTSSITVENGSKLIINGNLTISNLTINSGGAVEVNAAKQLTISTALTNNGTLTLKSAEGVGTATIITTGTVDGSGTTTVEQFVSSTTAGPTGRNWYISSPLSAATSSTITSETGNGLVSWNGSAWIAAGTTMDVMKGYIARSPNGNKTIKFSGGSLNTGNQSVSNLPVGFNLVGNPYASYVDFAQATRTEVASTIWYRSKSTGSYVFQTFNTVGSIGVNGGTNTIPPMQSFWIRTTAASNAFGFTNAMRSHQNQTIAANRLKAPAVDTQQLLRLEIANGTDTDETVVYLNENAINAFDDYDSQKLFNEEAGVPEIYTQAESTNLSINGLNSLQLQTEIPLGFRTGLTDQQASYQLKATKLQNFDPSIEVVLIDKFANNSEIVLTEGVAYSFTSEPVNTTQRFGLIFRTKSIITGACCFNLPDNSVQVFKNKQHQLVLRCQHQLPEHTTLRIYGLSGQLIAQQRINATETVISNALEKGIYIMQLHSNGNVYQSKIIF